MWNKSEQIDDNKRSELTSMLKKVGIAEEKIDDDLLMIAEKACFKANKLRITFIGMGMSDDKAQDTTGKFIAEALKKDVEVVKKCLLEYDQ